MNYKTLYPEDGGAEIVIDGYYGTLAYCAHPSLGKIPWLVVSANKAHPLDIREFEFVLKEALK